MSVNVDPLRIFSTDRQIRAMARECLSLYPRSRKSALAYFRGAADAARQTGAEPLGTRLHAICGLITVNGLRAIKEL